MTPSELKYQVESAGHSPHFFTRNTMKFFGDTMRNYGVRHHKEIITRNGIRQSGYELYRKSPVKHGNQESAYFADDSFMRIHKDEPFDRKGE